MLKRAGRYEATLRRRESARPGQSLESGLVIAAMNALLPVEEEGRRDSCGGQYWQYERARTARQQEPFNPIYTNIYPYNLK